VRPRPVREKDLIILNEPWCCGLSLLPAARSGPAGGSPFASGLGCINGMGLVVLEYADLYTAIELI
jgi:hypothetical protein